MHFVSYVSCGQAGWERRRERHAVAANPGSTCWGAHALTSTEAATSQAGTSSSAWGHFSGCRGGHVGADLQHGHLVHDSVLPMAVNWIHMKSGSEEC